MSATLIHVLDHHAKDKREIAYVLMAGFTTRLNPPLPGRNVGWQVLHGRNGHNSWRIYLPGSPVLMWYFTGYDKGAVMARNHWFWDQATERIRISSRVEALRFIEYVRQSTISLTP